jgi:putative nucleotidyltransferase with HDIG domain
MTGLYQITEGTREDREAVRAYLAHLDQVSPPLQEAVVTAWTTMWRSSPFPTLEAMPYTIHAPSYRLMDHVREVSELGMLLFGWAATKWDWGPPLDDLIPVLLLHDVDKPLLYQRDGKSVVGTRVGREVQHGVLGAFLLRDLGFNDQVVNTVATHAANSPFHGDTPLAAMLHYSDFFSADHALMLHGSMPFYQRRA